MTTSRPDQRLYDGSDPLYCPWTTKSGSYAYWVCRPWAQHFPGPKRVKLEGPTPEDRAAMARKLTRDVYQWSQNGTGLAPHTWSWLIYRYENDDVSPIQDVKANTRAGYVEAFAKIGRVIGDRPIGFLTYAEAKKMIRAMQANGRSDSYISRLFRHLRILVGYAVLLEAPGASKVRTMLGELKVKQPRPRSSVATAEQVAQIVEAADAKGLAAYATGLLIQWESALRGVDVFGHWLEAPGVGGIRRGKRLWQDGLTWSMVSDDCRSFAKVPSKTLNSLPEEMIFRLSDTTAQRLETLATRSKVGPVIVSERLGTPYTRDSRAAIWRALRADRGISDDVKMMDTRAGALTEAADAGASLVQLRDAAQHTTTDTTQRYLRSRNDNIHNVHELRRGGL
ncbi:hypothetical protein JANAI62_04010 [Jannaschia pagri]|uniref:Integrase n=1 Tax=Jannaschia pagri TaxID=2829797 RepID=A0ABQ4NH67_9RHOB|nr:MULTISPECIES: recombinase [unclassified Jannaschia]GIT90116.1 hypothetical protein JANAI61_05740 [Jannaschia sp. AI_61]GIT93778.1 hypothetical protein JANAI62_04010 [Jannaschia sp. AI_62]